MVGSVGVTAKVVVGEFTEIETEDVVVGVVDFVAALVMESDREKVPFDEDHAKLLELVTDAEFMDIDKSLDDDSVHEDDGLERDGAERDTTIVKVGAVGDRLALRPSMLGERELVSLIVFDALHEAVDDSLPRVNVGSTLKVGDGV